MTSRHSTLFTLRSGHSGLEFYTIRRDVSLRDWAHARDYVTMQWLMLQQEQPEDFVIATGRHESVRRFIELTAQQLGWTPTTLEELVGEMVVADVEEAKKEANLKRMGFAVVAARE